MTGATQGSHGAARASGSGSGITPSLVQSDQEDTTEQDGSMSSLDKATVSSTSSSGASALTEEQNGDLPERHDDEEDLEFACDTPTGPTHGAAAASTAAAGKSSDRPHTQLKQAPAAVPLSPFLDELVSATVNSQKKQSQKERSNYASFSSSFSASFVNSHASSSSLYPALEDLPGSTHMPKIMQLDLGGSSNINNNSSADLYPALDRIQSAEMPDFFSQPFSKKKKPPPNTTAKPAPASIKRSVPPPPSMPSTTATSSRESFNSMDGEKEQEWQFRKSFLQATQKSLGQSPATAANLQNKKAPPPTPPPVAPAVASMPEQTTSKVNNTKDLERHLRKQLWQESQLGSSMKVQVSDKKLSATATKNSVEDDKPIITAPPSAATKKKSPPPSPAATRSETGMISPPPTFATVNKMKTSPLSSPTILSEKAIVSTPPSAGTRSPAISPLEQGTGQLSTPCNFNHNTTPTALKRPPSYLLASEKAMISVPPCAAVGTPTPKQNSQQSPQSSSTTDPKEQEKQLRKQLLEAAIQRQHSNTGGDVARRMRVPPQEKQRRQERLEAAIVRQQGSSDGGAVLRRLRVHPQEKQRRKERLEAAIVRHNSDDSGGVARRMRLLPQEKQLRKERLEAAIVRQRSNGSAAKRVMFSPPATAQEKQRRRQTLEAAMLRRYSELQSNKKPPTSPKKKTKSTESSSPAVVTPPSIVSKPSPRRRRRRSVDPSSLSGAAAVVTTSKPPRSPHRRRRKSVACLSPSAKDQELQLRQELLQAFSPPFASNNKMSLCNTMDKSMSASLSSSRWSPNNSMDISLPVSTLALRWSPNNSMDMSLPASLSTSKWSPHNSMDMDMSMPAIVSTRGNVSQQNSMDMSLPASLSSRRSPQSSMDLSMPATVSTRKGTISSPQRRKSMDTISAKDQERQLRKEMLQQAALTRRTKQAATPPRSPVSAISTDPIKSPSPGMSAKDQERQLRKEILQMSQRQMQVSDRKLAASTKTTSKRPTISKPAVAAAAVAATRFTLGSEMDMPAKEEERQLRKEMLRQRNVQVSDRKLASAPLTASTKSMDLSAKDQERQLRKEMIMAANISDPKLAPSAVPVIRNPAGMDTSAKDQERELRKDMLQVASFSDRKLSPTKTAAAKLSQGGKCASAKDQERQMRKEALEAASVASRKVAPTEALPVGTIDNSGVVDVSTKELEREEMVRADQRYKRQDRPTSASAAIRNGNGNLSAKDSERQLRKEMAQASERSIQVSDLIADRKFVALPVVVRPDVTSRGQERVLHSSEQSMQAHKSCSELSAFSPSGIDTKEQERLLRRQMVDTSQRYIQASERQLTPGELENNEMLEADAKECERQLKKDMMAVMQISDRKLTAVASRRTGSQSPPGSPNASTQHRSPSVNSTGVPSSASQRSIQASPTRGRKKKKKTRRRTSRRNLGDFLDQQKPSTTGQAATVTGVGLSASVVDSDAEASTGPDPSVSASVAQTVADPHLLTAKERERIFRKECLEANQASQRSMQLEQSSAAAGSTEKERERQFRKDFLEASQRSMQDVLDSAYVTEASQRSLADGADKERERQYRKHFIQASERSLVENEREQTEKLNKARIKKKRRKRKKKKRGSQLADFLERSNGERAGAASLYSSVMNDRTSDFIPARATQTISGEFHDSKERERRYRKTFLEASERSLQDTTSADNHQGPKERERQSRKTLLEASQRSLQDHSGQDLQRGNTKPPKHPKSPRRRSTRSLSDLLEGRASSSKLKMDEQETLNADSSPLSETTPVPLKSSQTAMDNAAQIAKERERQFRKGVLRASSRSLQDTREAAESRKVVGQKSTSKHSAAEGTPSHWKIVGDEEEGVLVNDIVDNSTSRITGHFMTASSGGGMDDSSVGNCSAREWTTRPNNSTAKFGFKSAQERMKEWMAGQGNQKEEEAEDVETLILAAISRSPQPKASAGVDLENQVEIELQPENRMDANSYAAVVFGASNFMRPPFSSAENPAFESPQDGQVDEAVVDEAVVDAGDVLKAREIAMDITVCRTDAIVFSSPALDRDANLAMQKIFKDVKPESDRSETCSSEPLSSEETGSEYDSHSDSTRSFVTDSSGSYQTGSSADEYEVDRIEDEWDPMETSPFGSYSAGGGLAAAALATMMPFPEAAEDSATDDEYDPKSDDYDIEDPAYPGHRGYRPPLALIPGAYSRTPGALVRNPTISFSLVGAVEDSPAQNMASMDEDCLSVIDEGELSDGTALLVGSTESFVRDGNSSGLVEAVPIDEDAGHGDRVVEGAPVDIAAKQAMEEDQLRRARRCKMLSAVALALSVIIVTVSVIFGKKKRDQVTVEILTNPPAPTLAPTNIPTLAPVTPCCFLNVPNVTLEALENLGSPQSLAWEWIYEDILHTQAEYSEARKLQRFALATLFFATDGANWNKNDKWLNHSEHECTWHYIGNTPPCSDDETFGELLLYGNNLVGEIPPEISLIPALTGIDMQRNGLYGTVPTQISQLTNLEFLVLGANEMTGTIPLEVYTMSSLRGLGLQANRFSGSLPAAELGRLSNLEDLWLSNNQVFAGQIPSEIGLLTSLTVLGLNNNAMNGTIPTEFGQLGAIQEFWLSSNMLTGSIPSEMGMLGNLTNMTLSYNDLNQTLPTELGKLTKLEWMRVYGNRLTGSIPSEIGLMKSLFVLSLAFNELSQAIPTQLWQLTRLGELRLDTNYLSGSIPAAIGNFSQLYSLSMFTNQLTGTLPTELGNAPVLDELLLGFNNLEGTLPSQLGNLSNLFSVDLAECFFTGTLPEELSRSAPLRELWLFMNTLTGPIPPSFSSLALLQDLKLDDNFFNSTVPSEFGLLSNSVQSLTLSKNDFTGPLPTEIGFLTKLEHLAFSDTLMSGGLPSQLGTLGGTLLSLSAYQAGLTGTLPEQLGSLSLVREVVLAKNRLVGSIPSKLSGMTSVERLQLGDNQLTGSIPTELSGMTSVKRLHLSNNQLTGSIPTELGTGLQKLETLVLSGNQLQSSIPTEVGLLPRVKNVAVNQNSLTGELPSELGHLTVLEAFQAFANSLSGRIPSELGLVTTLRDLVLSFNGLTGVVPMELSNLANLTRFHLNGNSLSGQVPTGICEIPFEEMVVDCLTLNCNCGCTCG